MGLVTLCLREAAQLCCQIAYCQVQDLILLDITKCQLILDLLPQRKGFSSFSVNIFPLDVVLEPEVPFCIKDG